MSNHRIGKPSLTAALFIAACCGLVPSSAADNWPGWRGPTGQGLCEEKDLPVSWSATENVCWKFPLPDGGNSSPVVWGQRVFITQATEKTSWPPMKPPNFPPNTSIGGPAMGEKRSLLCLNRHDGTLLWQRDVTYKQPEPTHATNPYCSATPVTDGERIIVSHGSAGLVCYDMDGEELWRHDVGKLDQVWGNASSPVLHGDLVIHWCGPGSRQFLLALDKRTGDKMWSVDEPGGDSGEDGKFLGSWSTPLVARVGERDQIILSVPGKLKGFEPASGKELWHAEGAGSLIYFSPLYADGVAVLGTTGYSIDGTEDVTQSRLPMKGGGAQVGSGVIAGGCLYLLADGGIPRCFELETGDDLWENQVDERPATTAWGSMVHADEKLYITDQDGTTIVLAAGPEYKLLAQNKLDEHVNASLAICDGQIFIRTWKHLWCVGTKK